MANRSRRSGFEKKIDIVHWTYGSWSIGNLVAGQQAVNVLSAQHLPETLLRTRGGVSLTLDGAQASGVGVSLAMGLIVVPEGTGTTVLWSPITDGDAPWFWWDSRELLYEEAVADVVVSQNTMSYRVGIDSKAMRKIRNGEIQFVVENATIQGASGVNVFGAARFLSGS